VRVNCIIKRVLKITGSVLLASAIFVMAAVAAVYGNSYSEEEKFNMSYIYFGNSDLYYHHVEKTRNSLNGIIELTTAIDRNFIDEMHKKGVEVVPFISNHWNVEAGRNALKNMKVLTDQIVEAIEYYNLDGINVDIEGLDEKDRNSYTEFVKMLRDKLPEGKSLSVAVAVNPWGINKGWQGSYDYEELGKYSDYLMLMAYDQNYGGSAPGPVAGSQFVEDSIKYALGKIPKEKVVLGIPFYGRYWKSGSSYGGYGISLTDVEELIKNYRGQVSFDKSSMSAKAVITVKSWDKKPVLFGRQLEAGTYTIWYENEQSIKYKLSLVQKYDIKGTGSWSLGQELPQTWDYYKQWLNGCYFEDIKGHWAQEAICNAEKAGWMIGLSNNTFAPNNPLTRAEAVTVLVRAFNMTADGKVEYTFNDTAKHWARKEIEIARDNDIVLGTGKGRFEPDKPVTREEMAVILDRLLENKNDKKEYRNPYKDVNSNNCSWSYEGILRMTQYGVFKGNSDGYFYPDSNTTRGEMAALMSRIAVFTGQDDVYLAGK
jgi:spore germination protein YaaH